MRSSSPLVGFLVALLPALPALASPVLWIDDAAGNIGTVDVQTGEVHLVGASGAMLTDIAFDPQGGLWGISDHQLFHVNQLTGAATLVGSTNLAGGNALVFGADGTLYAAGSVTTQLYTVNTSTGAATSIGDVGFESAGDLAFHGGTLFLSSTSDNLIRITLGPTVSGTAVGPFGFQNVFGMATGDDGILYGVANTRIFSIDDTTGHGTLVQNYIGHGLLTANGTAFVHEAPAPGTLSLLVVGAVAGFRRHRSTDRQV